MNKTLKIVEIQRKPWWKFWSEDQWEVTVQINGQAKKVSVYESGPIFPAIFLDYVKYKTLYGDQWWDIHQDKKEEKRAKEQRLEDEVKKLVGAKISL